MFCSSVPYRCLDVFLALCIAWLAASVPELPAEIENAELPADLERDARVARVASELEWEAWREMVAVWNITAIEGREIYYPVNTPNEAACLSGPLKMVGGRGFEFLRSKRANSMKEAGYGMCPQLSLQRPGCVVYSCGVDEDPSFEVHLANSTRCDVFSFDPSPSARRWMGYLIATAEPPLPANLHFLPWGWSNRDISTRVEPYSLVEITGDCGNCFWPWDNPQWGKPSAHWEMKRLSSIAQYFNHSRVDLVKLDCEGVEYSPGFVEDLIALQPEQIVLEQHANRQSVYPTNTTYEEVSASDWLAVQDLLHGAGYRQIWKGRMAPDLAEYTLVHRRFTDIMDRHVW